MHSMHYQRWNPPLSPVRIEFPHRLVSEIAQEPGGETRGTLYGLLLGGEIRVLAARNEAHTLLLRERKRDEQLVGLERVGVFVRRTQGEVFLAEPDLERFEGQRAAVALVIAGDRAGFFVRQADGSIQTIRSHEEFSWASPAEASLAAAPDPPAAPAPVDRPDPPRRGSTKQRAIASRPPHDAKTPSWRRAATLFLAIPLAGLAYFRPSPPAAARVVQLHLQAAGAAVAISWNPAATARGGALQILDGSGGAKVDVQPGQSSLTYEPRTGRLEVRMTADNGDGPTQLDSAVLTLDPPARSPAPVPSAAADSGLLRAQIETLEGEAEQLRASLDSGGERIARLQKTIDRLTHRKPD